MGGTGWSVARPGTSSEEALGMTPWLLDRARTYCSAVPETTFSRAKVGTTLFSEARETTDLLGGQGAIGVARGPEPGL
jgi:hypothetical protein